MKVFLITKDFPPARGGISDVSSSWLDEMKKYSEFNIEVITFLKSSKDINVTSFTWSFLGMYRTYKKCLKDKPEIIIFNYEPHMLNRRGWPLLSVLLIHILACRFNLILSAHELFIPEKNSLKIKIKSFYQQIAFKLAIYKAKAVVVTTQDRVKVVSGIFNDRKRIICLIPNGPIFKITEKASNITNETIRILYFGSSHPDKGLDIIKKMSTYKEFHGKIYSIGGILGGDVIDLGFVPLQELTSKMLEFDIVILPFLDGASGRRSSFINTISLGLPLVTTFGINSPEHLKHSEIPYVLTEEISDFPKKVHALVSSAIARAEAAKASRKLYEEYYTWNKICQAWKDLIVCVNQSAANE